MPTVREVADELCRKLADQGKLVAGGWAAFDILMLPGSMGASERAALRVAYFSGAQHLFASILQILEPGDDATDTDMRRMSDIDQELRAFGDELKLRLAARTGRPS